MYTEFIPIYIGLVVIVVLLVIILVLLIKNRNSNASAPSGYMYHTSTQANQPASGNIVFCKNCATPFDSSLKACPKCGTPR